MNEKMEWKKLFELLMTFIELQNTFTKLRIQDLSEYIERPCSCPDCIMKALSGKPVDDEDKEWSEFEDGFREEWE